MQLLTGDVAGDVAARPDYGDIARTMNALVYSVYSNPSCGIADLQSEHGLSEESARQHLVLAELFLATIASGRNMTAGYAKQIIEGEIN